MSSTVCNERKTLPCHRNHFSRCSSAATVADSSGGTRRPLGQLHHHGDAHREVEPVQQMLGLRIEIAGQVADVFAAVGEEGDLLVGLHPLGGKHFEQSAFGFAVVGLHVAEAA